MNIKQKTAALATFANIILTVIKFITYSYTGSLAILAEAWHSLSDIATSFLVWLAVHQQKELPEHQPKDGEGFSEADLGRASKEKDVTTKFGRFRFNFKKVFFTEETSSLIIGLILLMVSLSLFHDIAYNQKEQISNSLVAGVLFLLFGISSYAVFQFETRIGLEENSVGLTSDGLHSKSDMIASFLTGGSLIAYRFGLDLDQFVGFFIALLIFFLAVEVLVMTYGSRFKGGSPLPNSLPPLLEFKTHRLLFSLFEPQTWKSLRSFVESRIHGKIEEIPVLGFLFRNGSRLLVVILASGYLSTAVYLVGPSEKGVVERFGKFRVSSGIAEPGIHLKLPWPLETAHLIDTESTRGLDIGKAVGPGISALIWGREHGDGQPFLAGDNNFLYPYLTIFYRIKDPVRFLNIHSQPDQLLHRACLQLMTETFAGVSLNSLFIRGRRELTGLLTRRLQETLDKLETGIHLEDICLKDIHPPISVASDFEAVVSAEQAKQTMILDSYSYQNSEIPQSRAKSENLVQSAEAYRITRAHEAHGEGERFRLSEQTFLETKAVTRLRLYLNAIQHSLSAARIILVDPKVDCPGLFLNTANLSSARLAEPTGRESPDMENSSFSGPLRPFETNQQLIEEVMDEGELHPIPTGIGGTPDETPDPKGEK